MKIKSIDVLHYNEQIVFLLKCFIVVDYIWMFKLVLIRILQ